MCLTKFKKKSPNLVLIGAIPNKRIRLIIHKIFKKIFDEILVFLIAIYSLHYSYSILRNFILLYIFNIFWVYRHLKNKFFEFYLILIVTNSDQLFITLYQQLI